MNMLIGVCRIAEHLLCSISKVLTEIENDLAFEVLTYDTEIAVLRSDDVLKGVYVHPITEYWYIESGCKTKIWQNKGYRLEGVKDMVKYDVVKDRLEIMKTAEVLKELKGYCDD